MLQRLHATRQDTTSFGGDRDQEPASSGEQAATPFRSSLMDIDCIVRLCQPIIGRGTRSREPEQSEHQQQQTADPTPCGMFTGILGPTEDANGSFDATKSTIASSQMNATSTLDATSSAETISRGTPSSFIVAATHGPGGQDGDWSSSSQFAADSEPNQPISTASSWIKAAVTSDTTTSAETIITPGSSSSFVIATIPAPHSLNGP
jgi:hypothetical protein